VTTGASNAAAPGGSRVRGSGVGIAIVDSGIGYSHQSVSTTLPFTSRDRHAWRKLSDWVQVARDAGAGGWVIGIDVSSILSSVAAQAPRSLRADPYGHGTHGGLGRRGKRLVPIARHQRHRAQGALYDVRVLDERGAGNVADVVAGIDWVIQQRAC